MSGAVYAGCKATILGTLFLLGMFSFSVSWAQVAEPPRPHSADTNGDFAFSMSELLRVIQLYNSGRYYCNPEQEDGFSVEENQEAQDCSPHDSDFNPQDWRISFQEVMRAIQFFNAGNYYASPDLGTEDGFVPSFGGPYHSADTNRDRWISQDELQRVQNYFNAGGYHCADPPSSTPDGYMAGVNPDAQDCAPHDLDFDPQDWRIRMTEWLRLLQFRNVGGYHVYCGSDDGFAPGVRWDVPCEE